MIEITGNYRSNIFQEDVNSNVAVENIELSFKENGKLEIDDIIQQKDFDNETSQDIMPVSDKKRRPSLIMNTNPTIIVSKKNLIETIEDSFKTRSKKAQMHPIPKKPFIISFFLMIIGFILIITGVVLDIIYKDANHGIALWFIGALCIIPGFYYSYRFYKAIKASTPEERNKELYDVPNE